VSKIKGSKMKIKQAAGCTNKRELLPFVFLVFISIREPRIDRHLFSNTCRSDKDQVVKKSLVYIVWNLEMLNKKITIISATTCVVCEPN